MKKPFIKMTLLLSTITLLIAGGWLLHGGNSYLADAKIFDVDHSGEDLEVFLILQKTDTGWKIERN